MTDDDKIGHGAGETEREMQEHEREARERDPGERDADGAAGGGDDVDPTDEQGVPGQGRGNLTG
jgi:hypothetical protein